MKSIKIDPRTPYHIHRSKLGQQIVDIGGRDIIIGFNEPAPKLGKGGNSIYSILNARFPTYFLPAIDIATQQKVRPQFYIVSGINVAMKWSASTEEERLIMLAHNKIKFDFLKSFLDTFYSGPFSNIEYIVSKDPLEISEQKLMQIWEIIERQNPDRAKELKEVFFKFKGDRMFDSESDSLMDSIKYAVSHLFAFGDINFEGNYYLNPKGFASIGERQEEYFNEVRNLAFEGLKANSNKIFDQPIISRDNVQIILEKDKNAPPSYNGATKGNSKRRVLDEVTYENNLELTYYDERPNLKPDMDYLYKHISKERYQRFWSDYHARYKILKSKYEETYKITL